MRSVASGAAFGPVARSKIAALSSRPRSKPERGETTPSERPGLRMLSELPLEHWRTYSVGGVIVLLALAGAWQGVNLLLVAPAVAVGLLMLKMYLGSFAVR